MATQVKKSKVDARAGEVVVIAKPPAGGQRVVFLVDRALRRGPMDLPSYVLQPGIPSILPGRLFISGSDGARMVRNGELEIVDQPRGVLPEVADLSDTALRAELRDGVRPGPNRQQVLEDLRGRYGEWSLAGAILLLIEHGWSEVDAAGVLVPEYKSAFERRNGDVTRQSWVRLAEKIIANNEQKGDS